ncbi:uncharacterized protein LOC131889140 isoform X1 [Tigriopus californicus]|uniref:uncharacterized protein LOC131889140 isoform X1 n=1 Tax=Tigriopus californicus TaxID=6832 RepID=UPI0027DA2C6B|nr:uncharacterized protein LOC131889140 isoform X1 [Tigriopus californicus]
MLNCGSSLERRAKVTDIMNGTEQTSREFHVGHDQKDWKATMKTARAKIKAKPTAAINCSPLRRRVFVPNQMGATKKPASDFFPGFGLHFKSSGVRRVLAQYSQMEAEAMSMKQRYIETKQKYRALRDMMKDQRIKSRELMVQCALKLQDKEREVREIQRTKDEDLNRIARELTLLRSNLLREQKRLQQNMRTKDLTIARQTKEIALLKARNDELERFAAKTAEVVRDDMDTPSSIESDDSPNSSFSMPKFVIKPKEEFDAKASLPPPPALPRPPTVTRRVRFQSADEAFLSTPKPDLPRKVFKTKSDEGQTSNSPKDSGRETDSSEYSDKHSPPNMTARDSRFSQFIEESGMNQKAIMSPSWLLTNHKHFRKPSEVKSRDKIRTVVSDLTVLEEHQFNNANGKVTKVMYWSEPYL